MKRIGFGGLAATSALAGLACGGTTGRPEVASPAIAGGDDATIARDAGNDLEAGVDSDATLDASSLYTGLFDVVIAYTDRELPDVQAAPEAGADAEAGPGLPDCPPFLPVDSLATLNVVSLGQETDQVPAVYLSDGGIGFAPDGSVCATYPWFGTVALDECLTSVNTGLSGSMVLPGHLLPPCNWMVDAGVAAQGPGAGKSRYDLCMALYECAVRTRCFSQVASRAELCFCGVADNAKCIANPTGLCLAEERAALEVAGSDSTSNSQALSSFFSSSLPSRWLNIELKTMVYKAVPTLPSCADRFGPGTATLGDAASGD
jgi:hypothetical protein